WLLGDRTIRLIAGHEAVSFLTKSSTSTLFASAKLSAFRPRILSPDPNFFSPLRPFKPHEPHFEPFLVQPLLLSPMFRPAAATHRRSFQISEKAGYIRQPFT